MIFFSVTFHPFPICVLVAFLHHHPRPLHRQPRHQRPQPDEPEV
jgi:hypothetical protein